MFSVWIFSCLYSLWNITQKPGLYLIPAHLHCGHPGQARKFSLGLICYPLPFILNPRTVGISQCCFIYYLVLNLCTLLVIPLANSSLNLLWFWCFYCVNGELEQVIRVAKQRSININVGCKKVCFFILIFTVSCSVCLTKS